MEESSSTCEPPPEEARRSPECERDDAVLGEGDQEWEHVQQLCLSGWGELVPVGTSQTITMGQNVYVGLGLTSGSTTALATARFDNVSVTSP